MRRLKVNAIAIRLDCRAELYTELSQREIRQHDPGDLVAEEGDFAHGDEQDGGDQEVEQERRGTQRVERYPRSPPGTDLRQRQDHHCSFHRDRSTKDQE